MAGPQDHSAFAADNPDFVRQQRFLQLASMFAPHDVIGVDKIRLGSDFDGGYVMLDDVADVDLALSFGVGNNADWDVAIADRGVAVEQYDHTIAQAPVAHRLIDFHPHKIVGLRPGASRIARAPARLASVILKVDIEGDEWPVFDACAPDDLLCFSQILVEFHDFAKATDDGWLAQATRAMTKLTQDFGVFHVHANNWAPVTSVANVPFPDVLEVSLANRRRYRLAPSDMLFPTALDRPNDRRFPDHYLGAFRYAAGPGA